MKAPKGYRIFEVFLILQFLHPDAIYMQKNSSESTDTAKQQVITTSKLAACADPKRVKYRLHL